MNDDQLLDLLGAVLAPEPTPPPQAAVAALRRAVVTTTTRTRRSWRVRVGVPTIAALTLAGTSGTAFAATGTPLPRPLRQVAHAAGLPVDSPELADARSARHRLATDLAHGDKSAVAQDASKLRDQLAKLDNGERDHIAPSTQPLLERAEDVGPEQHGPTHSGSTENLPEGNASPHGTSTPASSSDRGGRSSPTSTPRTNGQPTNGDG